MKWLYKRLISYEHLFEKGGKFEKLYPLYEAVLTIHFSSTETTKKGAHIRDALDTKRFMILVVIALIPTTIFGIYNAGFQSYLSAGQNASIIECFIQGAIIFLPILLTSYAVGGFGRCFLQLLVNMKLMKDFLFLDYCFH